MTGLSFELSETASYDETSLRGEGNQIWIYRIPDDAAQRLLAEDYPLTEYPMWCPLAFDGYTQIHWTRSNAPSLTDLQFVLEAAVGDSPPIEMEVEDVKTMHDARRFANALVARDGTLVAGWYTVKETHLVTNYFVYVMNLEQRILVKLSLLT